MSIYTLPFFRGCSALSEDPLASSFDDSDTFSGSPETLCQYV